MFSDKDGARRYLNELTYYPVHIFTTIVFFVDNYSLAKHSIHGH